MRGRVEDARTVKGSGSGRSRGCREVRTTHAGSRVEAEGGSGAVVSCWRRGRRWWASDAMRCAGPLAADGGTSSRNGGRLRAVSRFSQVDRGEQRRVVRGEGARMVCMGGECVGVRREEGHARCCVVDCLGEMACR